MKGLPLAYNRDMQEDKQSIFEALDTLGASLEVFAAMMETAQWDTERMASSCRGGFANATDLADYLVKKECRSERRTAARLRPLKHASSAAFSSKSFRSANIRKYRPLSKKTCLSALSRRPASTQKTRQAVPSEKQVLTQIENLRRFCKDSKTSAS